MYLRCLSNQFVFDDHEMIVLNRQIGRWSFLWKSFAHDSWWFRDPAHLPQSSYYRPLQDVWLGLNYHLFGLAPAGWHVTMVMLHLAALYLVLKIALLLCSNRWAALSAVILFGLLPVHAEAVVWPAAVPLPLAAVFELAAFYLLIRRKAQPRWRRFVLPGALFAAALLSHESAVAFPALVAAYGFLMKTPHPQPLPRRPQEDAPADSWESDRPGLRRSVMLAAPFMVETALYLALRMLVLGFISRPNPVNHATTIEALMTIPNVLVKDFALLAIPWDAGPSHRLLLVRHPDAANFYLPLAALLALVCAAVIGLGALPRQQRKFYMFCIAWMLFGVAPMLNLTGLFALALVQDRYLYLASMGWCLMLGEALVGSTRRLGFHRSTAALAASALAGACALSLWSVQRFWHDEVALFTQCVRAFPQSALWHNRLGMAFEARGNPVQAERELATANRLDPQDGATLFDLGVVHAWMGHKAEAAREIDAALKRLPNAPPAAYLMLARLYREAGDRERAAAAMAHVPAPLAGATPGVK